MSHVRGPVKPGLSIAVNAGSLINAAEAARLRAAAVVRLSPSRFDGPSAVAEEVIVPTRRPTRSRSAAALQETGTRTAVREAPTVIDSSTPGRMLVQLIRAGWSLNGTYYPAAVLKRDGAAAWPAGTLNYVDHDTDAEEESRPAGTLMRLASYQTTAAQWDEQRQALVAEVRVFAPWREAVTDWAESGAIGMSIRAWVYGEQGEAEGRSGFIVSSIAEGRSVDYVTVPAAGGAILSVLEAVQHRAVGEARNLGAWIESRLHLSLTQIGDELYGDGRLTREERITLSQAIGEGLQAWTARVEADAPQLFTRDLWSYPDEPATAAEAARRSAEATVGQLRTDLDDEIAEMWGGDQTYTWVRDFDLDQLLVWFDTCPSDGNSTTWQQPFVIADDGDCELTGDRIEVVPRTVYDPAEPEDEPAGADDTAEAVESPEPHDVTDGAPPTGAPNPPIEEEPEMSGTQTGAPPAQAGTATVVDTPPADPSANTGNAAVLEAVTALTHQVTTLIDANTALTARVDRAEAAERTTRNRATAREAVTAALNADTVPSDLRAQIAPRVTESVLANIPVDANGDVDQAALTERITAAVAAESGYAADLLERAGVGRPRGLGESVKPATADDFVASLESGFRALGMSAEAAKVAAQGRG